MEMVKEGRLYKSLKVADAVFDIYYGYYSEAERERWEPTPIYPDFTKEPVFTKEGRPFARADQDVCYHYLPKPEISGEEWCNDCKHFRSGEEIIGVCHCDKRNKIFRKNE